MTESAATEFRARRIAAPEVEPAPAPFRRKPAKAAGVFYYGLFAMIFAAVLGLVGAAEEEARPLLIGAAVLGLVGLVMLVTGTYRALHALDYLVHRAWTSDVR